MLPKVFPLFRPARRVPASADFRGTLSDFVGGGIGYSLVPNYANLILGSLKFLDNIALRTHVISPVCWFRKVRSPSVPP